MDCYNKKLCHFDEQGGRSVAWGENLYNLYYTICLSQKVSLHPSAFTSCCSSKWHRRN